MTLQLNTVGADSIKGHAAVFIFACWCNCIDLPEKKKVIMLKLKFT